MLFHHVDEGGDDREGCERGCSNGETFADVCGGIADLVQRIGDCTGLLAQASYLRDGTGNVLNNANLTLNRSNALSLSGDISGSGSLTQAGSGTTTLSGTTTFTSGTTISDGTLQIGEGGASGSITGDITNNAKP